LGFLHDTPVLLCANTLIADLHFGLQRLVFPVDTNSYVCRYEPLAQFPPATEVPSVSETLLTALLKAVLVHMQR